MLATPEAQDGGPDGRPCQEDREALPREDDREQASADPNSDAAHLEDATTPVWSCRSRDEPQHNRHDGDWPGEEQPREGVHVVDRADGPAAESRGGLQKRAAGIDAELTEVEWDPDDGRHDGASCHRRWPASHDRQHHGVAATAGKGPSPDKTAGDRSKRNRAGRHRESRLRREAGLCPEQPRLHTSVLSLQCHDRDRKRGKCQKDR